MPLASIQSSSPKTGGVARHSPVARLRHLRDGVAPLNSQSMDDMAGPSVALLSAVVVRVDGSGSKPILATMTSRKTTSRLPVPVLGNRNGTVRATRERTDNAAANGYSFLPAKEA